MDAAKEVYTDKRELPEGVIAVVYAEDQPEYLPLGAVRLPDGQIATRWTLTDEERKRVAETGEVFLVVSTFNQPLQPVMIMADPPEIAQDGQGRLFFYSPMWYEAEQRKLNQKAEAGT